MKRGNKLRAVLAEHHFVAICGSAEEVCAQEANRKSAAFPVKKPCVLRAALAGCKLADWKKDSSKPESTFDSEKSPALSRAAARQSQLEEGK